MSARSIPFAIGVRKTIKAPTGGEQVTALTIQLLPSGALGFGMQIEMPNKTKHEYLVALDGNDVADMFAKAIRLIMPRR